MRHLRWLGSIGRELAGIGVVILLVALLATMPAVQVMPASNVIGYRVDFKFADWGHALANYAQLIGQGTLGRDRSGQPIAPMVVERLGHSLMLLGVALALALVLGVAKGIWDFGRLRRKRLSFGVLLTGAVQGLPDFLLIFVLQWASVVLFRHLGWRPFPVAWAADQPVRSTVFPLVCLALIPWAYVARLTAIALGQVWEEDYIRTARAKGLAEQAVIYRHAFRNALLLILEGLPNLFVIMVSNLLIVEYLFAFPGLTILLKDAIYPRYAASNRVDEFLSTTPADVPLMVATGVALCLVFSLLYLAVGALRRLADPRRKAGEAA